MSSTNQVYLERHGMRTRQTHAMIQNHNVACTEFDWCMQRCVRDSIDTGEHAMATLGLLGLIQECHALREHCDSQIYGLLQPVFDRVDLVLQAVCEKYKLDVPVFNDREPEVKRRAGYIALTVCPDTGGSKYRLQRARRMAGLSGE